MNRLSTDYYILENASSIEATANVMLKIDQAMYQLGQRRVRSAELINLKE